MQNEQVYTEKQIANAKKAYTAFMQYRTVESFSPETMGWAYAEQQCDYHNKIVAQVAAGNKEVEREWKMFFLREEVKADRKAAESAAKKAANKEASADILAPVKAAKKMGEFGKWLNTAGNPFRKEHFSKKYTAESVAAFMNTL